MIDSIYHTSLYLIVSIPDLSYFLTFIKIRLKSHFCRKNDILLSLCTPRCYERRNVSQKYLNQ